MLRRLRDHFRGLNYPLRVFYWALLGGVPLVWLWNALGRGEMTPGEQRIVLSLFWGWGAVGGVMALFALIDAWRQIRRGWRSSYGDAFSVRRHRRGRGRRR